MVFVDRALIMLPPSFEENCLGYLTAIVGLPDHERSSAIDKYRDKSWGNADLVMCLRSDRLVGNKCWYSEAPLDGADCNVDHFRPKGKVKEVDVDNGYSNLGECNGYWWLAFDWRNFRLSSQHANQRRVDEDTSGGKWDYFPVQNARAQYQLNANSDNTIEDYLPIDPCSASDVKLIWFNSEGKTIPKPGCGASDGRRVKISEWLYHLNKWEIEKGRKDKIVEASDVVRDIKRDHTLFIRGNAASKAPLDSGIAKLKRMIKPSNPYSRAVFCYASAELKGTEIGDMVFE